MATKKKTPPRKTTADEAVAKLKKLSSKATRDGMARYGIPSDRAFGVPVGAIRKLAKDIGRDHELAEALWRTGHYEARMLAAFLDDPALVTPAQMDRWCKDFDNWAITDTVCFHLFDKTPHAFAKITKWADKRAEFEKRAAFALLASIALHDKKASDAPFIEALPLIERAATDERNFVKKGVSWALRGIGGRRSPVLKTATLELAERLAGSADAAARFTGKEAMREFAKKRAAKK